MLNFDYLTVWNGTNTKTYLYSYFFFLEFHSKAGPQKVFHSDQQLCLKYLSSLPMGKKDTVRNKIHQG